LQTSATQRRHVFVKAPVDEEKMVDRCWEGRSSIAVFLNRRAAARYRGLASIIPSPRLREKRISRAAVSQRLKTTAL
jgi:hypothetical protein